MVEPLRILDISEIIPKLFIGSRSAAQNPEGLKENGITHIVTLDMTPLPSSISNQFEYKFIYGLDIPKTDLLSHFDECAEFIEKGTNNGGVLVHW